MEATETFIFLSSNPSAESQTIEKIGKQQGSEPCDWNISLINIHFIAFVQITSDYYE